MFIIISYSHFGVTFLLHVCIIIICNPICCIHAGGVDYSFGDPTSSVSSNNTRALVSVPIEIFEDVVAEFDEVFMLTISSGLFNTSITVIILDNDGGFVRTPSVAQSLV